MKIIKLLFFIGIESDIYKIKEFIYIRMRQP